MEVVLDLSFQIHRVTVPQTIVNIIITYAAEPLPHFWLYITSEGNHARNISIETKLLSSLNQVKDNATKVVEKESRKGPGIKNKKRKIRQLENASDSKDVWNLLDKIIPSYSMCDARSYTLKRYKLNRDHFEETEEGSISLQSKF